MTPFPIDDWRAVLGLGGNIGTEAEIVERFTKARLALAEYGPVWSASLYRTAAIGPQQQDFLNTAVMVRIDDGQPDELVAITREIELMLGRDRRAEERWGPRKIDLDILVWGNRVVRTPHVELPHPRLKARRFALWPLIEMVTAYAIMPGTNVPLIDYMPGVENQKIEKVATTW
jgi:2-amino-4-hydroxy-6-hydroxymethyldihydropteridine diphosphokinase